MKFLGFEITRQKAGILEGVQRQGTGILSQGAPPSPFTAAMNALLSDRNYLKSPRRMLELYRLMYYSFPFFPRAMKIRTDFVGCPHFVSEDDVLQNELNDWAEEMPIYKLGIPYKDDKGVENYAKRMLIENYKWGMSFSEIKRAENSMEVAGVCLAPSDRFDHTMMQNGQTILTYTGSQGTVYLPELYDVDYCATMPNGEWPWADAMGTYGEYFMAKAIRFMEARTTFEERVGNPTIMTLFSPEYPPNEQIVVDPQSKKEAYEEMRKAQDALNQAQIHRLRTGKATDITAVPKMPVKMQQYAYGAGISGTSGFENIFEIILAQLQQITDVPSTFLGISASAGIGSEKFRVEKAFLEARSKSDRNVVENNIYKLSDSWLLGMKVNPKWLTSYDIHWETTNIDDAKIEADTKAVNALTLQTEFQNFMSILMNSADAANIYAEETGHPEWKTNEGSGAGL